MATFGVATARRPIMVPVLIVVAWAVILAADWTGTAGALHHHALIEGGLALPNAAVLFLAGWVVTVAAMMLPASLPTIAVLDAATEPLRAVRRVAARGAFLCMFTLVWIAFGLVAFFGDDVLHHVVYATPWLAGRPWLISAAVLAIAGAMQFAPQTRRSLAACRHPVSLLSAPPPGLSAVARHGLRHGFDCLGASWALMLLMFAEGLASPVWMAALTALMVYEANGRHAARAVSLSGAALLLIALATLTGA